MSTDFKGEALAILRQALGPSAQFRSGQLEAITSLVQNRSRLLIVQRTGWGKSAVYFVATRLLRDAGARHHHHRLALVGTHARSDSGGVAATA